MTDDPGSGDEDSPVSGPDTTTDKPEEKMSLGFYASLALIGILVLMVIVLNYPAEKANAGNELVQANWTLRSLADSNGVLGPAQSVNVVTARFDGEGRMSGNAGCNRYSAAYQTRDYSINITATSSTKRYCQPPVVRDQESAFLADLSEVSSFRASGSSLNFYDSAGKPVLVFEPE